MASFNYRSVGQYGRLAGLGERVRHSLIWIPFALILTAICSTAVGPCPNFQFVGKNTCLACHDGRSAPDAREFLKGPHAAIECESCHGPGYAHVRAGGRGGLLITNPSELPFTQSIELCSKCHQHDAELAGFKMTRHAETQAVTCHTCHDVHTENAMTVPTPGSDKFTNDAYAQLCGQCHGGQVDDFMQSGHVVKNALTCGQCHNMHKETMLIGNPIDNTSCLQCHGSFQLGFDTDAAVDFHTGPFHPVDPAGSGASRCVGCHMPPLERNGQPDVPHDHTLFTIPPQTTVDLLNAGVQQPPPNSCAGTMGCHDGVTPGTGIFHDLDDVFVNENLQAVYETIGDIQ